MKAGVISIQNLSGSNVESAQADSNQGLTKTGAATRPLYHRYCTIVKKWAYMYALSRTPADSPHIPFGKNERELAFTVGDVAHKKTGQRRQQKLASMHVEVAEMQKSHLELKHTYPLCSPVPIECDTICHGCHN